MVDLFRPVHKVLHFGERVRLGDVHCGEQGVFRFIDGEFRVEGCEEEDEQDETVFAAVIGEGEFFEGVLFERIADDVEGGAGSGLDAGQGGVLVVRFFEEGLDERMACRYYRCERCCVL